MNSLSEKDMPKEAAAQALWHAQLIVPAMKEMEGVTLDWNPDSMRYFDALLKKFHQTGITAKRVPKIAFQIGCYLGQVVINMCPESKWMHPEDCTPNLNPSDFPYPVVFHPNNLIWSPITKVVKAFDDPESNSLLATCIEEIAMQKSAAASPRRLG
jgi:hypothetical protein